MPTRVIRKPYETDAVRVSAADLPELLALVGGGIHGPVREIPELAVQVRGVNGPVTAREGDWVLPNREGTFQVVTAEEFDADDGYEVATKAEEPEPEKAAEEIKPA